jgi:exosome complex component RRP4
MIWDQEMRVPNTIVVDGKTYATVLGMVREDRFIPLELVYRPKPGDNVVGVVTDVRHAGYSVDINLANGGFISSKFSRVSFQQGDLIFGRIKFADEVGNVDITDAKRLPAGKLLNVPASKVPRIIGKKSSMLNVIRDGTGCSIFVGNNGYIWIGGKGNLQLTLKTIDFIIGNAHKHGLTDKVAEYLNENGGSVTVPPREEAPPAAPVEEHKAEEPVSGLDAPAEETPEPAKEPVTEEPAEVSEGTPRDSAKENESQGVEEPVIEEAPMAEAPEESDNPLMKGGSSVPEEEKDKIDVEEM